MSTHPSAQAPVTEFVGQLFFRLWRAAHVRAADVLESVGLTPALFGLLDQLEGAGLAKRRPSATDRRAREIAITPKGRRLLERARRMILETEDEVLAGL